MSDAAATARRVAAAARHALLNPPEPWPTPLPDAWMELRRLGATPLAAPDRPGRDPFGVSIVLPSFRHGSGGHQTIVHLSRELVARGHRVSLWMDDIEGRHASHTRTARQFARFFGAADLQLHGDLSGWNGDDVVVATSWPTVARVLRLPGARARAYLVQDHEPEFYPTSIEAIAAADSYRTGLTCVTAGRWLAELLRERYGADATAFPLAVDHSVFAPVDEPPGGGRVVFYARAETPRRAQALGVLALAELSRRRPTTPIAVFGNPGTMPLDFPHEDHATLAGSRLADLFRGATVGLSLSLTNPSLIPLEMMASGLPCVELDSAPMLRDIGADGPLALTSADPLALCDAIERLLDDPAERARRRAAGIALMRDRTWDGAAAEVQAALGRALHRDR